MKMSIKTNVENISELTTKFTDFSSNKLSQYAKIKEYFEINKNFSDLSNKKANINIEKNDNINFFPEMINKKYNKAFEALENLISDDAEDIKDNCKCKKHRHKHRSRSKRYKSSIKNIYKALNSEIIFPVPKLDFSSIIKKYKRSHLKIIGISKKTKTKESTGNASNNIKKLNNDEHHRHHHNNHKKLKI